MSAGQPAVPWPPPTTGVGDELEGAELEQSVVNALYAAFAEGRDIDTQDIAGLSRRGTARPLQRTTVRSRSVDKGHRRAGP